MQPEGSLLQVTGACAFRFSWFASMETSTTAHTPSVSCLHNRRNFTWRTGTKGEINWNSACIWKRKTLVNSSFTAKDYRTCRITAYHLQSSTFCSTHATWYDISGGSSSNQAGKHLHPSILYMEEQLSYHACTKLEAFHHF